MGTIHHDALIIQAHSDEAIAALVAHQKTVPHHLFVGPIRPLVNPGAWFFWAPDGSKEGWQTSDYCDRQRGEIILIALDHRCTVEHLSFGELGVKWSTHNFGHSATHIAKGEIALPEHQRA
jgi:hypothetical protein